MSDVPLGNGDGVGVVSTPDTEHFRTDHLLHNIGHRAVSGGVVTVSAQAAKFVLNFAAAAVLARLLSPKEFGLVGMVLGVTGLVGIFKELGLSTATVQRETITQQQVSNLFWINVAISGILAVFSLGLAPLVAWFYRDPRVAGIMLALSLTFLLTGSTVQHQALLTRQMRFRTLAVVDVTSILIGFATACVLAWFGFAYWALVAQQLVYATASLVLTWCASGWRPSMPKRKSGVRPMVNFGAHLTVADLIGRLSVNSDNILIGRFFGAVPLGLYTRANVLLARPLDQVLTPISAVLIPVLSRLHSDPERYRRTFLRAYDALALVTFPFAAMCLVLSQPLVLVVLGPRWTSVIPLFSAFALVAISSPLSAVSSWMFESQGRGRDQLHNHTLAGAVTVGAFWVGLRWGPHGMILALAFTSLVIRLPIVSYMAGRRGPVSTRDLWIGFFSNLPCWGAVYLTTTLAYMTVEHAAPIVQLLVCVPAGLGAGAALIFLFRRPRASASFAWNTVKSSLVRQWSGAA
ncbi:MAG: lipopolysaccharide biosynthesis protein [Acidobacteriia bacterium]|nr:lipopolysaccharide biosynthesis protein [Terriglobia bacterium]